MTLFVFLEAILFVVVFLGMILFVWCCTPNSERSPVIINFTLAFSSSNDLDLLIYRKHSRCKAETLASTLRFKNRSLW